MEPIIFKFDIEQAIKKGILVEFDVRYLLQINRD